MENELEEIKQKTDIVSLVNEYVPLKKAGRNYKALCPFHSEKTPSFMVSPDRQIFKCFGCNEGGDVLEFVKRIEGIEFGEVVKKLANKAGITLKDYRPSGLEKKKDLIFSVNQASTELYNYLLTKHKVGKPALDYLHLRKINDYSIKKFQLGFAPEKGDIAIKFLLKRGFNSEGINMAGQSSSYLGGKLLDRFRGRIIFPIKDSQGRTLGFSGRSLGSREPKYLNSPDTLVFNKSNSLYGIDLARTQINKQKTSVLVEGNIDVIASHQVGVTNVVAPLGTAITQRQIDILRRFSDTLLISFDTDIAGDAAAKRGIELAESAGFSIKMVDIGSGKDPDELIRKSPESWKKKIKEAVSIYDFLIKSSLKKWDKDDSEGKKKIAHEVLPVIAKLPDEISRDHYVRKIASHLKVSEEAVRADLKKYLPTTYLGNVEKKAELIPKLNKLSILENYLLTLIIQSGVMPDDIDEDLFSLEESRAIFQVLKKHFDEEDRIKIKKLSKSIPEKLLPVYDEILLYSLSDNVLRSKEDSIEEISTCMDRIKELNLRSKLKKLGLEIKQAEAVSESVRIENLTKEFRDLSLQLTSLKTKE